MKRQLKVDEPVISDCPVLGLDLSLTGTGWFVTTEAGSRGFGVIGTTKTLGMERIQTIRDYIKNEIVGKFGNPFVVVEGYALGAKGHQHEIGEMGGVVKMYLYETGIPLVIVPPTVVKRFACGMGNAQKNVIMKEVYKRWDFDTNDDNIADAFVLNKIGEVMFGRAEAQTSVQLLVAEELLKEWRKPLKALGKVSTKNSTLPGQEA